MTMLHKPCFLDNRQGQGDAYPFFTLRSTRKNFVFFGFFSFFSFRTLKLMTRIKPTFTLCKWWVSSVLSTYGDSCHTKVSPRCLTLKDVGENSSTFRLDVQISTSFLLSLVYRPLPHGSLRPSEMNCVTSHSYKITGTPNESNLFQVVGDPHFINVRNFSNSSRKNGLSQSEILYKYDSSLLFIGRINVNINI